MSPPDGKPLCGVPRACPVCAGEAAALLFDNRMADCAGYDFSSPVVSCAGCGCAYSARALPAQDLARYYTTLSKYDTARSSGDIAPLDLERARLAVEFVAPSFGSLRSVLDVGCSSGLLLHRLREAGVPVVRGIDPAADAPANAQAIFGVPVEQAQAEQYGGYGEYDLVCLMAVLEHLLDPLALLRRIAAQLRPGARVLIEVPDAGAFDRPGDERPLEAFGEFSNEHINFFAISDVARLAQAAGLAIERWRAVRISSAYPGLHVLLRKAAGDAALPAADAASTATRAASAEAVGHYIGRSRAMLQEMERRLQAACTGPVLVYGAGNHTARLMCQSATLQQHGITAVFDRNAHLQGKAIGGVPILAPERSRDFPGATVVISTFNARREIHAALSASSLHRVVRLYD
jgi:SAM-dependent methyltransferase